MKAQSTSTRTPVAASAAWAPACTRARGGTARFVTPKAYRPALKANPAARGRTWNHMSGNDLDGWSLGPQERSPG